MRLHSVVALLAVFVGLAYAARVTKLPLTGRPGTDYFVQLRFGADPTEYTMLVDSGSAVLAVATENCCDKTVESSFEIGNSPVVGHTHARYGIKGSHTGWEASVVNSVVSFVGAPALTATSELAAITHNKHFFRADSEGHPSKNQGILGLAYRQIGTSYYVDGEPRKMTPLLDTLVRTGALEDDAFSHVLCAHGGTLALGGITPDMYDGPLMYAPIIAKTVYIVPMLDVLVGDDSLVGQGVPRSVFGGHHKGAIVDSGTTDLVLPAKAFDAFVTLLWDHVCHCKGPECSQLCQEMQQQGFFAGIAKKYVGLDVQPCTWPTLSIILRNTDGTAFSLPLPPTSYLRCKTECANPTDCSRCTAWFLSVQNSGEYGTTILGNLVLEPFAVVYERSEPARIGFARKTSCFVFDELCSSQAESHANLETTTANVVASSLSPVLLSAALSSSYNQIDEDGSGSGASNSASLSVAATATIAGSVVATLLIAILVAVAIVEYRRRLRVPEPTYVLIKS